jgi:hypothetical protein
MLAPPLGAIVHRGGLEKFQVPVRRGVATAISKRLHFLGRKGLEISSHFEVLL